MNTRKEIETLFGYDQLAPRDKILFQADLDSLFSDYEVADQHDIDPLKCKQIIITLSNFEWYQRGRDTLTRAAGGKADSLADGTANTQPPGSTFFTVQEAAEKLRVHPNTVYEYSRKTRPKNCLHRSIRLTVDDLQKFANGDFAKRGRPPKGQQPKRVPFPTNVRGKEHEQPIQPT